MKCPKCDENYDSEYYIFCPNCPCEEPKLVEVIISDLYTFDKAPEDIVWVGSDDGVFSCDWEKFTEIAKDTSLWVSMPGIRLVVVGHDWWLREITEFENEFGKETMISRTFEYLTLPRNRDDCICLSEAGVF